MPQSSWSKHHFFFLLWSVSLVNAFAAPLSPAPLIEGENVAFCMGCSCLGLYAEIIFCYSLFSGISLNKPQPTFERNKKLKGKGVICFQKPSGRKMQWKLLKHSSKLNCGNKFSKLLFQTVLVSYDGQQVTKNIAVYTIRTLLSQSPRNPKWVSLG